MSSSHHEGNDEESSPDVFSRGRQIRGEGVASDKGEDHVVWGQRGVRPTRGDDHKGDTDPLGISTDMDIDSAICPAMGGPICHVCVCGCMSSLTGADQKLTRA